MNIRRIVVTICILVLLLLSSVLVINYNNYINDKEKKDLEIKINNIYATYYSYVNGTLIDNNDDLSLFLNNKSNIHNYINGISLNDITFDDVKTLSLYKSNLDDIYTKLSSLELNNDLVISDEFSSEEKEAIKYIYDNSIVTKSIDSDIKLKEEILSKIDSNYVVYNYLEEHSKEYYIENNKIVCKNDEVITYFKNLGISASKEIDKGKKIPILMYHAVDDTYYGNSSLFVMINDFDKQMKYLSENGYTTLFLSEIGEAYKYDKPVIITFDDGYKNVYDYAFPILKKYNLKSDVYIISNWLDGVTYVSSDMVKEMDSSNLVEIGVHTLTHKYLASLSYNDQYNELVTCKNNLSTLLNKNITTVAYPYGSYNSNTINIANSNFTYGVTTESGFNYSNILDKYRLKRFKIYRGMSLDVFINTIS